MLKKLRQKRGETLIEALLSMLIAVLAMGFLSTAVGAASKMNMTNEALDEKFATDLQNAEAYLTGAQEKNLTIEFDNEENPTVLTVNVYGGTGTFASYLEKQEATE